MGIIAPKLTGLLRGFSELRDVKCSGQCLVQSEKVGNADDEAGCGDDTTATKGDDVLRSWRT